MGDERMLVILDEGDAYFAIGLEPSPADPSYCFMRIDVARGKTLLFAPGRARVLADALGIIADKIAAR